MSADNGQPHDHKDHYKTGVELAAQKPIIYIDPNKFDKPLFEDYLKRNDMHGAAIQIIVQIESQSPGLSRRFLTPDLVEITKDSLKEGVHSRKVDIPFMGSVCLINQPKGDEISLQQIYSTMGMRDTFRSEHLRDLPGSNEKLQTAIGVHEGAHCEQQPIEITDPKKSVKILEGEKGSDFEAIEYLKKNGEFELIAAFKALRALSAANGDANHATGIFLGGPKSAEVTIEHLNAAQRFTNEMTLGVAENLGVSSAEATRMRRSDPQRYAKAAEDALEKGIIPVLRNIKEGEALEILAGKMGIPNNNVFRLSEQKSSDASAMYRQLKADGSFQNRGEPNPHINKYIEQYIAATKLLFIPDTTPKKNITTPKMEVPIANNRVTEPSPPPPTAEEIAAKKASDLKDDAEWQAGTALDEMVGKALGLSEADVVDLATNNPDKLYDVAERELKKGNAPTQTDTPLPPAEVKMLIAKRLGVNIDELPSQPKLFAVMAEKELKAEGALSYKENNPHIGPAINTLIEKYRQQKIDMQQNAPAPEPLAARSNDGQGIPQVDLHSADKGQMKIGGLTASEYFATKADPVLATAALEIKEPDLTTKLAQNSPSYLIKSSSMQA